MEHNVWHLAESEQDESDIDDGLMPWGYHEPDLDEFTNREQHVVETDFEIELHYRESLEMGIKQPVFVCAYCADAVRSRSLDNVLRWWNSHACLALEHREALARIYDAADLPAGHPFAPIVNGRLAA